MKTIVNPIPNDETQNVMALLPVDIVYYNILTKLPTKSLLRFKSVCKDWYNLINSSNFININIHHQHTHEASDSCDFLVVCTTSFSNSNFSYMYFDALNYTSGKYMELKNINCSYGYIIGSSNGLVCFKFVDTGFLLCNPVTREYSRSIESPSLTSESPSLSSVDLPYTYYGFGYDEFSHDYKIVKIEFGNTKSEQDCIGHVYSTNSNLWKEVRKNHNLIEGHCYSDVSVVVNNRLHWIIFKNNGITEINTILNFDLHAEELREISYPTSLKRPCDGPLELMVTRGRLCTLATDFNYRNMSMWMMKEYGVVESWTKLYDVEGEQIPLKSFEIITQLSRRNGEEVLLLRSDKEELVWYNLNNKSITGIANDPTNKVHVKEERLVCIASLAHIPGNDPNNRRTDLAKVEDVKKEVALAYSEYLGD